MYKQSYSEIDINAVINLMDGSPSNYYWLTYSGGVEHYSGTDKAKFEYDYIRFGANDFFLKKYFPDLALPEEDGYMELYKTWEIKTKDEGTFRADIDLASDSINETDSDSDESSELAELLEDLTEGSQIDKLIKDVQYSLASSTNIPSVLIDLISSDDSEISKKAIQNNLVPAELKNDKNKALKYLYKEKVKSESDININLDAEEIKHKTNPDLELLQRLKGYLSNGY